MYVITLNNDLDSYIIDIDRHGTGGGEHDESAKKQKARHLWSIVKVSEKVGERFREYNVVKQRKQF